MECAYGSGGNVKPSSLAVKVKNQVEVKKVCMSSDGACVLADQKKGCMARLSVRLLSGLYYMYFTPISPCMLPDYDWRILGVASFKFKPGEPLHFLLENC